MGEQGSQERDSGLRRDAERALEEKCRELESERARVQSELAQERFLLQALLAHLPDHIYFKDRASRFIRAGKAMANAFGLDDPALLVGKTDFDFFTEEHARQAYRDEQAVMDTGQALILEEKETWRDQPDSWVESTKVPLRDESGAIVGTFGISHNITERRRVEAAMQAQMLELKALNDKLGEAQGQLLQAEKMASVGQLAAGVAHEINNPIGFISSNLNSLRVQVGDLLRVLAAYQDAEPALAGNPAALAAIAQAKAKADFEFLRQDVGELIDESLEGTARVKKIVDDLKDFSRVDSAQWQNVNLEDGLDSTLNIVRNEIKYKAEVRKSYAGLPPIECIAGQINQVFMNLLLNAAQAIELRGVIALRTGYDADSVWVEVADSGKGILPEHLGRVFEPFFTTKPVGQGTGLGLSLAYGIVQRHHGRLEVTSEAGQGSVFRLTLPRRRPDEDG